MSRQRLKSLSQLLLIRGQALENATQAMMQARSKYEHAKLKQEQLGGYRKDYLCQLEMLGDKGCQVSRLRHRIDFIAQLDAILQQVSHELDQLLQNKIKCEQKFHQCKAEHEAVERLMATIRQNQEQLVARAEQKENDEHAQKQWYRNKQGG